MTRRVLGEDESMWCVFYDRFVMRSTTDLEDYADGGRVRDWRLPDHL